MPVTFPDGNDIPAVGSARPMGTLPYSDLAVFLDGNIYNDSPGNVLDLAYFEKSYSYKQFIEDTRDRANFMQAIRRLEEKLRIARLYFLHGEDLLKDYRPEED